MSRSLKESDKKIVASNQLWKCGKCDEILPSTYQIDHIIPFSITRDDCLNNLEALCPNCHSHKTQIENFRINKFKKLCAKTDKNLCWFCLEELDYNHKCNRVCKKIVNKKCEKSSIDIKEFNKYIFTGEPDIEIDDTLKIKLETYYVWVNNYFTDIEKEDYTPERICKAIHVATRSKKFSNKYTKIEIEVDLEPDEETPEELIDYLEKEMRQQITKRIFKRNCEIEYTFIC